MNPSLKKQNQCCLIIYRHWRQQQWRCSYDREHSCVTAREGTAIADFTRGENICVFRLAIKTRKQIHLLSGASRRGENFSDQKNPLSLISLLAGSSLSVQSLLFHPSTTKVRDVRAMLPGSSSSSQALMSSSSPVSQLCGGRPFTQPTACAEMLCSTMVNVHTGAISRLYGLGGNSGKKVSYDYCRSIHCTMMPESNLCSRPRNRDLALTFVPVLTCGTLVHTHIFV